MADQSAQSELAQTVSQLEHNRDALAWPQRRTLAKTAAEQMRQIGPTEATMTLLLILAEDPKWEVRKDVADCLILVPDDEFPRLAAKLSQDSNLFVRKATERAMDRRRRGQQAAQKKRHDLDQLQGQYARMEKAHGATAAEKARQLAERQYDMLVGTTVHDMRNILGPLKSGIRSMLSHLNHSGLDARRFEKNLSKMAHQIEMLEQLLEDMRAYSQPTPANRRRERLADVVRDAHNMVLDSFRATGRDPATVMVEFNVPDNLTAEMSRHQIVQAVSNILKNAYESFASDPQNFSAGEVHLVARAVDGEYIEIVVKDTGMGLSAEELEEVSRFVPGGTSKKTHGTGFGLPIAKRKIEDHGGSLALDSEEDKGTAVTITLPVEAGGGGE